MKVYEFGNQDKPVILLLPGTCCHWKCNFGHVIDGLVEHFRVAIVSYDGFDETENSTFISMLDETEKIEDYIQKNYGGSIHAAYGCSLGGSFVAMLIERKNVRITHGIIGSSDMDQMPKWLARAVTAVFYLLVLSGTSKENCIASSACIYKCTHYFWNIKSSYPVHEQWRLPYWFYKWADERKYDYLLFCDFDCKVEKRL